jgi:hypothetical protein
LRRDAGANSSKVGIPWKIRWDERKLQAPSYQPGRGFFIVKEIKKIFHRRARGDRRVRSLKRKNCKESVLFWVFTI